MKKPEPVNTTTVCSVCGLDWKRHGQKPTLEKCVELLKADLAKPRFQQPFISAASGTGYGNWVVQ